MKIQDRETIKVVALMLPEHVKVLKEVLLRGKKSRFSMNKK